MPEPQVSPGKKGRAVKTILYSDKSETSVEELMDDTCMSWRAMVVYFMKGEEGAADDGPGTVGRFSADKLASTMI